MTAPFPPEYPSYAQAGQAEYRVPAASALAQCIQESSGGKYTPAGSNNVLGIQQLAGLPYVVAKSFEFRNGKRVPTQERFAKFATVADCFMAHAKLIATNPVYAKAMALLPPKGVNPTNAQADAFMLAMGPHYATAPHYAQDVEAIERVDNLYPDDILVTVAHANDLHAHNALPPAPGQSVAGKPSTSSAAAIPAGGGNIAGTGKPSDQPAPSPVDRINAVQSTLDRVSPTAAHETWLTDLEAVVARVKEIL